MRLILLGLLLFISPVTRGQGCREQVENLLELDQTEEALLMVNRCIGATANDPELYLLRSLIRLKQDKPEDAHADLKIAMQLQPENRAIQFTYASLLYRAGKFETALNVFESLRRAPPQETSEVIYKPTPSGNIEFLTLNPGPNYLSTINYYRALCLYELGRYPVALVVLDSASIIDRPRPEYLVLRGDILEKSGKSGTVDYTKALALDSAYLPALNRLRIQLDETPVIVYRDDVINLFDRAKALEEDGKFDKAILVYNQILKLNPNLAIYWFNRGVLRQKLKDFSEAIQDYTSAIKIDDRVPSYWLNRGTANYGLKKYQEALQDFSAAITLDPEYSAAYLNRGMIYLVLKNKALACKDLERAVQLGQEIPPNSTPCF